MPKREYLGEIDPAELGQLFENKHRVQALIDLKKTLNDPAPVVLHMLEGISSEQLDKEIQEARIGKEKGFAAIYNKYQWMQVARPENISITKEGKVYDTAPGKAYHCDSKTCGE
jgi:hypothetical protein